MQTDYLGYAIGILGLFFSIYFYVKSIKVKMPIYSMKTNNLVSSSESTLENLQVLYKAHEVDDLSVTQILFYNNGAETITKEDIQTIYPLRISSEMCKVLDGSVKQANHSANNFTVRYDEHDESIYIEFDYLDKNQGAIIQVIHTGLSSNFLNLTGDIRGVKKILQMDPENFSNHPSAQKPNKVAIGAWAFFFFAFWAFAFWGRETLSSWGSSKSFLYLLAIAIGIGGIIASIVAIIVIIGECLTSKTE